MPDVNENHIETLGHEVNLLRSELRKAKARLSEAEQTLRFYATPKNWKGRHDPVLCRTEAFSIQGDSEPVGNESAATLIGGAKAREYFRTYGGDE